MLATSLKPAPHHSYLPSVRRRKRTWSLPDSPERKPTHKQSRSVLRPIKGTVPAKLANYFKPSLTNQQKEGKKLNSAAGKCKEKEGNRNFRSREVDTSAGQFMRKIPEFSSSVHVQRHLVQKSKSPVFAFN